MGESYGRYAIGRDSEMLKHVSSCNIACGFHAGDPVIISQTIQEAILNKVKIGAHPSFPDLQGFGRRDMNIKSEELIPIIQYQIAALDKLCEIHGGNLHHVKPHGALYNQAYHNEVTAAAIITAFEPWRDRCVLYVQYGSAIQKKALESGLKVMVEGFSDRRYTSDLNLVSRQKPDAVYYNIPDMIEHCLSMIGDKKVMTSDGYRDIEIQTLCIHGDHDNSLELASALKRAIIQEGISIG